MPTISVIVPVYKVEKYIHQCVDSILAQTFTDFELILVDDGSPDGCPAICDEYAKMDSRVKVIHKENGGLSAARNVGLDIASGEYFMFVDSDDWLNISALESIVRVAKTENADMVICGVWSAYETNSGEIDCRINCTMDNCTYLQDEAISLLATQAWYYVIACNKLYQRRLFSEIRFPEGFIHEDAAVMHRLFGECNRVSTLSAGLYYYRQSNTSIMGKAFNIQRTDNLTALADRICYASEKNWIELGSVTVNRYVWMFFDYYFRFKRTPENELYFNRMEASLRIALPHILRSRDVSIRHKIYLTAIRICPRLFVFVKETFKPTK